MNNINFSTLAHQALKSLLVARMGLNQDAAEKYRKDGKPEAAAICEGRYEAYYEIHSLLKTGED